jgi:hypothetical protein
MPRSIFPFKSYRIHPHPPRRQFRWSMLPLLFRLVAAEYLMGKGLTGGGSRRYLWASFMECFDVTLRTGWLSR